METNEVIIFDPSEYRPDIKEENKLLRNYDEVIVKDHVKNTYYQMHTNQSVMFVKEKRAMWGKFDHAQMSIMEAIDALDALVDESDPDVDLPNSVHAYQTAERIREKHPDKPWFQLTGLIHDAGKVMALFGEPQWAVVGDTFPVGCAFSDKIVFGKKSFTENPDYKNPAYNSKLGIYEENCGLDSVMMSWGHDEYMYQVLKNAGCTLPEEAYYMIRYHSFYPWHTGGDYNYLCNNKDNEMLNWVLEFNKFDLYSKTDELPDVAAIKPYYQELIDKYIPGKIKW